MADPTDDNDIEDWLPVLSFDGFLGEEDGEAGAMMASFPPQKPRPFVRRDDQRTTLPRRLQALTPPTATSGGVKAIRGFPAPAEAGGACPCSHGSPREGQCRSRAPAASAGVVGSGVVPFGTTVRPDRDRQVWRMTRLALGSCEPSTRCCRPCKKLYRTCGPGAPVRTQVECPYRRLPQIFAPQEGLEILSSMIDRPPKYQEKYLAQEWSILAKVWALAPNLGPRSGGLAVVDIGAGNGSLALLAGLLLGGHAVLIDHTLPPEPMRVEARLPEQYRDRILRVTGDVGDLDASREIEPILEKHGIRQVVVIAKHLCGTGTDLALKLLRRWCSNGTRVEVLGAVIATCCMHKINTSEEKEVFADIHSSDSYLRKLTGDKDGLLSLLSVCTRCVAWRTTAGAEASRITEKQIRVAEMFEDLLQQPRLKILQHLFPSATEVAFVPFKQSPQNRCLLAGSELGVRRALATGDAGAGAAGEVLAALASARDSLLAVNGTALDLRPHGMVSTRFDYDGT
ncbi:unnamed protein product [Durusdinium trenchii]|uniref:tRNA:m(4)X modification enzyme TRM13 n=1 Tax=Durusdinium trenchii TaxID=1381693 RepID=A0ABP0S3P5_9DINO